MNPCAKVTEVGEVSEKLKGNVTLTLSPAVNSAGDVGVKLADHVATALPA